MIKGEIWLADLPPQTGREQIGKRPVIILSDTKTGLVVIIPIKNYR